MVMEYEWDEPKRRRNREKHGVDFVAARAFDWDAATIRPDNRTDYGEPRYKAYGYIGERFMVLVYTRRAEMIRVISLRRANRREIKRYA